MKTIGKFLVKGKKRTIYTVDDKKYYYRTKKGKHYINKPRDYKKNIQSINLIRDLKVNHLMYILIKIQKIQYQ